MEGIPENFSKRVFRRCLKFCRQHHFWWRCATSKKPEQSYESKFAAASGGGTFLWKCQIFNKNLQNFAFRRFNSQLFFPRMVDQLPAFPTLKNDFFGLFSVKRRPRVAAATLLLRPPILLIPPSHQPQTTSHAAVMNLQWNQWLKIISKKISAELFEKKSRLTFF